MVKWEYKILSEVSEESLNLMGLHGWELVTVTEVMFVEEITCKTFYFKKELK